MTPKFNDDPKLTACFQLIVAIICAGLWLRYSLTPSYGWIIILLGAAGWLVFRSKRDWWLRARKR